MDPEGFVRWQSAFNGAILVATALLGHPLTSLILAGFIFVGGLALELRYQYDSKRRRTVSEGRRVTDTYARQCWVLGGGVPLVLAIALLETGDAAYRGFAGLTQALAIVLGVAFVIVILSGLIDWYYVLPRIAGEVCPQPCRSSGDARWKRLTRIWYLHRGVAAIAQALVWLAVIPVILSRWVDANQVGVVVAVVSAVALIYVRGLDTTAHMVLHPSFYVGDLVHLIIPGGKVEGYLVDVSVEGVKIKETERGVYTGTRFGPDKHTYKIDSTQLSWIGKSDQPFHGCAREGCAEDACSGVNWYCRCNPNAYAGRKSRRAMEKGLEAPA
jgi:hypothetical protein